MISERYAKLYCKDDISLIENYDIAVNDKTRRWVVHHRRGTIYSKEGLIEIGEYYKRPAIELIFMLKEEHDRFHNIGKRHSEDTKKRMSKANAGNRNPFFGKHHTEEYRKNKSKPIIQYTKDGELLKEWFGAKEVERVLGIYQGNITKCCQGIYKSAGGFVWRYK